MSARPRPATSNFSSGEPSTSTPIRRASLSSGNSSIAIWINVFGAQTEQTIFNFCFQKCALINFQWIVVLSFTCFGQMFFQLCRELNSITCVYFESRQLWKSVVHSVGEGSQRRKPNRNHQVRFFPFLNLSSEFTLHSWPKQKCTSFSFQQVANKVKRNYQVISCLQQCKRRVLHCFTQSLTV